MAQTGLRYEGGRLSGDNPFMREIGRLVAGDIQLSGDAERDRQHDARVTRELSHMISGRTFLLGDGLESGSVLPDDDPGNDEMIPRSPEPDIQPPDGEAVPLFPEQQQRHLGRYALSAA